MQIQKNDGKKINGRTLSSHTIFSKKSLCLEPKTGLEPVTHALRMRCSTN